MNEDLWILVNANYYYTLLKELNNAQKSILVIMFVCVLNEGKNHPIKKVLDILIAKAKKGLNVQVILDDDEELAGSTRDFNKNAFNYLRRAGIDVRWDDIAKKSHTKLVVIDGESAFIGAHNWTISAFFHNREISVYLKDKEKVQWLLKRLAEDPGLAFDGKGFIEEQEPEKPTPSEKPTEEKTPEKETKILTEKDIEELRELFKAPPKGEEDLPF